MSLKLKRKKCNLLLHTGVLIGANMSAGNADHEHDKYTQPEGSFAIKGV